jgi:DNA-binding transcriptional regulator GbsR (MarR family)
MARKKSDDHFGQLHFVPEELEKFSKCVGEFVHFWGFKEIHGRIWTHLYLSSTPLDAGVLKKRLKASKALISISLRELLKHQVIIEVEKTAHGTQAFCANPDLLAVIFQVLRNRELKMVLRIEEAFSGLSQVDENNKSAAHLDSQHMQSLGQMISNARTGLQSFLEFKSIDFSNWPQSFT